MKIVREEPEKVNYHPDIEMLHTLYHSSRSRKERAEIRQVLKDSLKSIYQAFIKKP